MSLKVGQQSLLTGNNDIISLPLNTVSQFTQWSLIEEAVLFLQTFIPSLKADVLHEQTALLDVNSHSTIVRVFTYFAISQTSCNRPNDF